MGCCSLVYGQAVAEGEASLGATVKNGVVRPDRQDHHLVDGLGDPTAL